MPFKSFNVNYILFNAKYLNAAMLFDSCELKLNKYD